MTIDIASNDSSLERALVQCLRLFAKHGRKVRRERLSLKESHLDSEEIEIEKEIKDSSKRESAQKHSTTKLHIERQV
jgi:hypothetical protein